MIRTSSLLSMLIPVLLFTSVGCVRAIHPILNDDQVIIDNSIVGKWVSADGKAKCDVQPPGADDKTYKVVYTDDKDKTGNFIVRLGKIDTMLIAEIHPADPAPDSNETYKAHLLPMYSFLVVNQTSPQLIVSSLSIDWLKKYIADHPNELATVPIGKDDFAVSASTAEFQAFILKHCKDEEAMGDKTTFVRP